MNQKNTTYAVRFVPVAMALVLFFILGLLALTVQADELEGATSVREKKQSNIEERKALHEEQVEDRKQLSNERRKEIQNLFEGQQAELKEKFEERKQEREERIEGYKARLSVQQQVRLSTFSEAMSVRMTAMISRLENIANRTANRIEKIENEHDVSLTQVNDSLQKVYALIETVKENTTLFNEISMDTFTSENPKAQIEEVREVVQLVKESLLAIHQGLQDTVVHIKASSAVKGSDEEGVGSVDELEIKHTYSDGVHTYSSTVELGECMYIETMAIVAESYPEQITIDIIATSGVEVDECAEGSSRQEYETQVEAGAEAKLVNVQINGELVNWRLLD